MFQQICTKCLITPLRGVQPWRSLSTVTALHDFHVSKGGKMVDFGGFRLPLQYADQGVVASHLHTRKSASVFDVSHMLQTEITGRNVTNFMETICTADLQGLPIGKSTLTLFTNENAGILDDLIITKIAEDHLYIVSNAARKDHDKQLMLKAKEKFDGRLDIRFLEPSERSLLALQGPKAAECLQAITDKPNLTKDLLFMSSTVATVAGVETCRVTRCGYTGEDGFEISIPAIKTIDVAEALLSTPEVKLAGLAARDSLRIEAGLCLYGTDIDENRTPAEAVLMWLIGKSRRQLNNYPGANRLNEIIKSGPVVKRAGFVMIGEGPPARHGTQIYSETDTENPIGEVTSGCPSPSLGKNIGMGYVKTDSSKIGTELLLKIRNKFYKAIVTKMPFIKSNYYVKQK